MSRRQWLGAAGAVFVAWPLASAGQSVSRPARVGLLRFSDLESSKHYLQSFRQGLRELGYLEGNNLVLELRFADGKAERLPALAAELVKLNVDVIVATDTPATRAAQQATKTTPIVMANVIDPVASGFVAHLSRPGGNITGLANSTSDASPKNIELLVAMVPGLSRIAVLLNPANSGHPGFLKSIQDASARSGIKILPLQADTPQKIESAFIAMTQDRAGALVVATDAYFTQQRRQIAELALKHRLPAISGIRENAEAGILMSYGQDPADLWRRSTMYVDKILKGAKPGDLPVEQPTKFSLVINRKTAKALGITLPQELLLRADKVIE
jgi:putative ABC transport system substrate-binding protein